MNTSPTIGELAKALSKAQGEMEGAKKDSVNPFHNKKYADLFSCWEAIRKPLTDNGLALLQLTEGDTEMVVIISRLQHDSGEFIESVLRVKPTKQDAQGQGSAATYGKRYALMGICGIAPEDDDGNEAIKQPEKQAPPKQQPRPQQVKPQPEPKHPLEEQQAQAHQLALEITRYISSGIFTEDQVRKYGEIASIRDSRDAAEVEKLSIALKKIEMKLAERESEEVDLRGEFTDGIRE